ncbi:hypothetical protein EGW08_012704, partial [Elysia chlorotica]
METSNGKRKQSWTLQHLESEAITKEDIALRKFKERVSDLITTQDDFSLMKWLKARCFDVDKAEAMFRTSMAYRERMKVDTLLTDWEPPEVIQKYMTGGPVGHDKEGSTVRVELYGRLDMKGLMYSCRRQDMERFKLMQNEELVRDWEIMSKKLNKRVDGVTVIFDMEGVSSKMLWRPGLQMYLHLVRTLEDNYPEALKKLFIVNAPRIFPLLYKIARPLVSEDTKKKIHVLGVMHPVKVEVDYNNYFTHYPPLPSTHHQIKQGGPVPEKYYLNTEEDESCCQHMTQVTVARGDQLSIDTQVKDAGSVLRWEFKTDGYDIGFGVFRQDGGEKVAVVPVERVNSHMVPEDGSYSCDVPGTYTVVFDNSYSKIRDKRLLYFIDVITVDESEAQEMLHLENQ